MSSAGPNRSRLAIIAALCLIALLAAIALSASHGSHRHSVVNPSAPLVLNPEKARPPAPQANEADGEAQLTARKFLASYLPVLYGRKKPATIAGADRHVLESLGNASQTQAMASPRSHPRIAALNAVRQADGSVLEIATVNDGISQPYRLVFTVAQQRSGGGAWQVTQLANY